MSQRNELRRSLKRAGKCFWNPRKTVSVTWPLNGAVVQQWACSQLLASGQRTRRAWALDLVMCIAGQPDPTSLIRTPTSKVSDMPIGRASRPDFGPRRRRQICWKPFVSNHLQLRNIFLKNGIIRHRLKCGNRLTPVRLLLYCRRSRRRARKNMRRYVAKVRLMCAMSRRELLVSPSFY
jgi:hypothetical protein